MTTRARVALDLTAVVEAAGGAVEISDRPLPGGSKHAWPHVTVLRGETLFTTQRPTLRACAEEVTRWLQEAV